MQVNEQENTDGLLASMMKAIFDVEEEEITCDECFEEVDRYVDMLRAGQDAASVLPHVKHHLDHCQCCHEELQALITILEAQTDDEDASSL
jgi:hypothetical protein